MGPCVDSRPKESTLDPMISLPAEVTSTLIETDHKDAKPFQLLIQNLLQYFPIINENDDHDPAIPRVEPNIRLFLSIDDIPKDDPFYVTTKRNKARYRENGNKKVMRRINLLIGVKRGGFQRGDDLLELRGENLPMGVSACHVDGFHGTPTYTFAHMIETG